MAFSFNWAGLVAPSVSYGSQTDTAAIGANAGKALRGYRDREKQEEAAQEYSSILSSYGTPTEQAPDFTAIQDEIRRLKARNAEIARQLGI